MPDCSPLTDSEIAHFCCLTVIKIKGLSKLKTHRHGRCVTGEVCQEAKKIDKKLLKSLVGNIRGLQHFVQQVEVFRTTCAGLSMYLHPNQIWLLNQLVVPDNSQVIRV